MKNPTRTGSRLSSLLLATLLGACGSPTAPEVEGPDAAPPEPPEPTYAYAVTVETRYIDIVGSCDKDIFGDEVSGEFQFHISVGGRLHYSTDYNKAYGTMYQRNGGTNIDFRNRTYVFDNLQSPGGIDIAFRLAEWDGLRKDSRMQDRSATLEVPYALGTRTRKFTLGEKSDCRGTLFYDVTWSRETVG